MRMNTVPVMTSSAGLSHWKGMVQIAAEQKLILLRSLSNDEARTTH